MADEEILLVGYHVEFLWAVGHLAVCIGTGLDGLSLPM